MFLSRDVLAESALDRIEAQAMTILSEIGTEVHHAGRSSCSARTARRSRARGCAGIRS